jgi:hypothetical protein
VDQSHDAAVVRQAGPLNLLHYFVPGPLAEWWQDMNPLPLPPLPPASRRAGHTADTGWLQGAYNRTDRADCPLSRGMCPSVRSSQVVGLSWPNWNGHIFRYAAWGYCHSNRGTVPLAANWITTCCHTAVSCNGVSSRLPGRCTGPFPPLPVEGKSAPCSVLAGVPGPARRLGELLTLQRGFTFIL